jgi:hypothetical protein
MSDGVSQDLWILSELTDVMSDGFSQDLWILSELTDVMSDGVSQELWMLSIDIGNNPWGQYQPLIPLKYYHVGKTISIILLQNLTCVIVLLF